MTKIFKLKNNKGFSMVELVVSISLMSLILVALMSFIWWMNYYNSKTRADNQSLDSASRALNEMVYEIKGAKSIYTPTTTASQLSLETTHYLPSDESDTFIDFFLCGSALCLKKESQDPIILTSDNVNVSSLSFTKISNGSVPSVQIRLTVNYNNPNNDPSRNASVTLTSTASLRNY